ncbi:MAG: AlpA family phage regulatory protein [Terracidiphilus sp.]
MDVLFSSKGVLNGAAAINAQNESGSVPVLAKGERRALRVGKIREVSSIVKMAPSTIRAKMRAGEFPVSIRLSYKMAVWNLDEIEAWFQQKLNTAPVYVPNCRVAAEVANG